MFAITRSLGLKFKESSAFPDINIVVSNLDHDANFTPHLKMVTDLSNKIGVRRIDINLNDCTLNLDEFEDKLDKNTVLVCLGLAANACGTVNPVKRVIS